MCLLAIFLYFGLLWSYFRVRHEANSKTIKLVQSWIMDCPHPLIWSRSYSHHFRKKVFWTHIYAKLGPRFYQLIHKSKDRRWLITTKISLCLQSFPVNATTSINTTTLPTMCSKTTNVHVATGKVSMLLKLYSILVILNSCKRRKCCSSRRRIKSMLSSLIKMQEWNIQD